MGKTDTYTSKSEAQFELALSEDSLSILLVNGKRELAEMTLANFTRPLGEKRFYTDAGIFLKDCQLADELERKVELLTSLFNQEVPSNWKAFFREVLSKVNPLNEEMDFKIFKIDPKNRELLEAWVRDQFLNKLFLKAEGYLILIAKKDVSEFKKRLQELGYLLE